ncbi:MAG: (deoxy)nucleoside triphosphate pyrophosphohydrolase [Myxococcales bacterium]|nr:(deoxy)nucleoside triphosphate pyrophosphohydrolase [Myxococcales bacterium]
MKNLPTIRVVAAVIAREAAEGAGSPAQGRGAGPGIEYLITQRRPSAALPLLWEFPGGRVEPGESDAQALAREIHYRLGVEVAVGQLISFVNHRYDHYVVDLYLYDCRVVGGDPEARAVHAFRWVRSADFDAYPFTPADESSMTALLGLPEPPQP